MHRSGTSAVAGTAVRLGAEPPSTPLDASDDNPLGFYESKPAMELNHALMRAAGCAWNLCLHQDATEISRHAGPFRDAMVDILREEFRAARLFVLKDPRFCLTVPAWLPVLRDEGIGVSALIVCRHPAEVARSLAARNGLEISESVAQWLHHMAEAERATRSLPRAVVFYGDLLDDWRRAMLRAGRMASCGWPKPDAAAEAAIDAYLARELRHQDAAVNPSLQVTADLVPLVGGAWDLFGRLREDPHHPELMQAMDDLRTAFAGWRRIHYPADLKVDWPVPV